MTAYILRRIAAIVPLLLITSFIVFMLVHLAPGDMASTYLEKAPRSVREEFRCQYHLDQPVLTQFMHYLDRVVLHGDFGTTPFRPDQTIAQTIGERLPATIELTFAAMALAIFGGLLLGILSAIYKNSWIDYTGMTVALVGVSVPVFWLGLLLLMALGGVLGGGGRISPEYSVHTVTGFYLIDTLIHGDGAMFLDALRHLILPALALATIPMAMIARITRSSMLEVMGQDYIRTARAKGLSAETVIMRHTLRNAMIPIVTLIGLEFGYLLGGAVLTESVFTWPGMGTFLTNSVSNKDSFSIQAGIIVLASTFIAINLVVDILYAWIDPRIHYS